MSVKSLVLFLCAASSVLPASFTASTFCTAGRADGVLSTSTANPCRVNGFVPGPFSGSGLTGPQVASAGAVSSFDLTGNTFTTRISVDASSSNYAFAEARLTLSDVFLSEGPVRPGIVRGWYQPSRFTSLGGTVDYGLTFPGKLFDSFGPGAPPMTVTLGQLFPVNSFVYANTSGNDPDGNSPSMSIYLQLGFFEADGVTPVAIAEVPEPSTYALAAIALFGCLMWRRPLQWAPATSLLHCSRGRPRR